MAASGRMFRFVTKHDGFSGCIIFYCNPISAFSEVKEIPLNSVGRSNKNSILRFVWVWSPFPPISAPAAFGCTSQEVRLHCITNDVGISTNFIRIYIIFGESFFVVHVLPRTALVVHIDDIPLHLGEGGVVADDRFRFDALKSFEKISTHKQRKTTTRMSGGFYGSGRRIRTLTNRVRVCRATLTQSRYVRPAKWFAART